MGRGSRGAGVDKNERDVQIKKKVREDEIQNERKLRQRRERNARRV